MQDPIGPFVLEHACAELTALLAALEAVVEMPHCDWLASHLTGLQSSTAVAVWGAAAQMSRWCHRPESEKELAGRPVGRLVPLYHGGQRAAAPVWCATIEEEVDVHQLRVGHWRRSEQYYHHIGRRPTDKCQQCSDTGCPTVRCLVCRVATDTPAHILLECPYLLGLRLRSIFNIFATESDIRKGDVVADSASGYTVYKSRGRCMERIEPEVLSHMAENIR